MSEFAFQSKVHAPDLVGLALVLCSLFSASSPQILMASPEKIVLSGGVMKRACLFPMIRAKAKQYVLHVASLPAGWSVEEKLILIARPSFFFLTLHGV